MESIADEVAAQLHCCLTVWILEGKLGARVTDWEVTLMEGA